MSNNPKLLFLISIVGFSADVSFAGYITADSVAHSFSNFLIYSNISGITGNPESINLLRPSPEYIIFLSMRTISSAGMGLCACMCLWKSMPSFVRLRSSSVIRD